MTPFRPVTLGLSSSPALVPASGVFRHCFLPFGQVLISFPLGAHWTELVLAEDLLKLAGPPRTGHPHHTHLNRETSGRAVTGNQRPQDTGTVTERHRAVTERHRDCHGSDTGTVTGVTRGLSRSDMGTVTEGRGARGRQQTGKALGVRSVFHIWFQPRHSSSLYLFPAELPLGLIRTSGSLSCRCSLVGRGHQGSCGTWQQVE